MQFIVHKIDETFFFFLQLIDRALNFLFHLNMHFIVH